MTIRENRKGFVTDIALSIIAFSIGGALQLNLLKNLKLMNVPARHMTLLKVSRSRFLGYSFFLPERSGS